MKHSVTIRMGAPAWDATINDHRAQATERINSVQQAAQPSFADAAIRIVSGGVNAMTGYNKANTMNFAS
ncbi:MAG TPA: hypothetical protein VGC77_09315 [Rhodopseudomonas sp.]|uniref:hypothetical protein n=1 Tax=Rhodopseudomonas sp. TaxID=1078 RepID=UPI002ED97A0F